MRVATTWWVRIVYFVLLLFVEWNHAPGDQRNSGDCPELDLRGEQWRWPNSLLGSVKCSTGSTASKENGEECGETHGMLPRVSGITNAREHSAWVRRSVCGNGGCFQPESCCLCVPGADELARPERLRARPCVALSGLREWPWVGPKSGLREAVVKRYHWRYQWIYVRPVKWAVCCDLWVTASYVSVYGRWQGLDQTVSALWVKGELGKFSRHMKPILDQFYVAI